MRVMPSRVNDHGLSPKSGRLVGEEFREDTAHLGVVRKPGLMGERSKASAMVNGHECLAVAAPENVRTKRKTHLLDEQMREASGGYPRTGG